MLNKFRQRFPKTSLVSEFLGVNNGVYAVQCRIVGDGLSLNAIASGSTVEMAEDAARDRALKLFFAGEGESCTGICVVNKKPEPFLSDAEKAELAEPIEEPTEPTPIKKRTKKTQVVTTEEPSDPVAVVCEVKPAIATPESDAQILGEFITSGPEQEVVIPDKPVKTETAISPSEPVTVEAPVLELVSPVETPQLELIPSHAPLDFEAVMIRTTNHLKRLGWTNEDGKNYLTQTYGKKSRQLLTDEELIEFLNYLESQP